MRKQRGCKRSVIFFSFFFLLACVKTNAMRTRERFILGSVGRFASVSLPIVLVSIRTRFCENCSVLWNISFLFAFCEF